MSPFRPSSVALQLLTVVLFAAGCTSTTETASDTSRLDVPSDAVIDPVDGNVTVGCKDDDDCLTAGAML